MMKNADGPRAICLWTIIAPDDKDVWESWWKYDREFCERNYGENETFKSAADDIGNEATIPLWN